MCHIFSDFNGLFETPQMGEQSMVPEPAPRAQGGSYDLCLSYWRALINWPRLRDKGIFSADGGDLSTPPARGGSAAAAGVPREGSAAAAKKLSRRERREILLVSPFFTDTHVIYVCKIITYKFRQSARDRSVKKGAYKYKFTAFTAFTA